MQSAWKWSPWVGSLQSDSANSYFTTMINSSKMMLLKHDQYVTSPWYWSINARHLNSGLGGERLEGVVDDGFRHLSHCWLLLWWRSLHFGISDGISREQVDKKDGDPPERPRWERISCSCPAGWTRPPYSGSRPLVIGVIAVVIWEQETITFSSTWLLLTYKKSPSPPLGWSSQMKNHLLLYLVGPHEGLLRTHRVALGLNPWLKVVVVIVMSFELT